MVTVLTIVGLIFMYVRTVGQRAVMLHHGKSSGVNDGTHV